jgi:hypothetical protein
MKKVILSLLFVAAGLTAFADPSARVRISYDGSNTTIRQDADKVSMEAFGTPSIAVLVSGTKYAQWQDTNIEGLALQFTPAAENVSFAFSYVIGDLYLVDNGASPVVRKKIVSGETYDFTVAASEVGTANATRFYISKVAGKEICYKYEALEISDYNGWNLTVTEKGKTAPTINVPIESDYFKQSLADKTAGYYVVKLSKSGETDIEYIISVKPTVVPAN